MSWNLFIRTYAETVCRGGALLRTPTVRALAGGRRLTPEDCYAHSTFEAICAPSHVANTSGGQPLAAATHVACASTGGRILTFEISELKSMEKGGRGLMLIDLEDKDTLAGACAYTRSIKIEGIGRGGKERDETLEIRSLNNARAARGRKGKAADLGFKPNRITRVE